MPGRILPLVTGQIYHVFNRGIDRRVTFSGAKEYQRAVQTCDFYSHARPPVKLSRYLSLGQEKQNEIISMLRTKETLVSIICYCLMPNHFHLLLKQESENGISKFLSNLQNSYTKFYNTKHNRNGPLFMDQFKAVIIETEEQLIHVARYIHLNPFTGYVVKKLTDLESYPWSSLPTCLDPNSSATKNNLIMSYFSSKLSYKEFVFNQGDYQRKLKRIEHLALE